MRVFFVSGSDTDVGKTYITSNLIQLLQSWGKKALAIKPIETGVQTLPQDCLIHLKNAQNLFPHFTLQDINLYSLPLPASPFVADSLGEIDCEKIFSHIASLSDEVEILLVEGAGGLFVPIKEDYFMLSFALELQKRFESEVIFVCDDRLGMLNRLLSGKFILESNGLKSHYFINLRDKEVFEKINLPFLLSSPTPFISNLEQLAQEITRTFHKVP